MDEDDFVDGARAAGSAWQASSADLPEAARAPSPYGGRGSYSFVLPGEHRWLNLLPEAREVARSRFAAAKIRWHGDEDGPNAHACSSQIQCLNALAPLVDRPDALAWIFGRVLPIAEVLPFSAETPSSLEATDCVVFEWQGMQDHLHEWGRDPVRGAHATSADAAIRYRTPEGAVEVALVEWKYVESYRYHGRLEGTAEKHESRLHRYRDAFWGPDGVVRTDLGFDYEDLFAEPVYQLARTQALAAAMEAVRELGADCARFVYAAPSANEALMRHSLGSHRFEQHVQHSGGDLIGGWSATLRRSDRFVYLDTACLMEPDSPVSEAFRQRYAPLASRPVAP